MEYVARSHRNPFALSPPCDQFVPGYGNTRADFHVIGDHPGVHGGETTGIPFTDRPWSERFFDALVRGGLVRETRLAGDSDTNADFVEGSIPDGNSTESAKNGAPSEVPLTTDWTFFSYLHMCVPARDGPDADSYATLEPFFDAELRAITAHVLLPVGERATSHVLRSYTARRSDGLPDMEGLHARELHGSGWLVIPIEDPSQWSDTDEERLVETLRALVDSDYRQVSDLGRFVTDGDSYFVR